MGILPESHLLEILSFHSLILDSKREIYLRDLVWVLLDAGPELRVSVQVILLR